jgi:hypothetical protein
MRPKPRIPSVFSCSSTPENFERSHFPLVSDAWAWGTFRASALGCGDDVGLRCVGDQDSALGRGRHVDVVDSDAGPADRLQPPRVFEQRGVELGRRADQDAVELPDPLAQLLGRPADPELDLEVLLEQAHAGVADLLGHQHARATVSGSGHRRSST